jgi:N6-L-threonylcarbamoyladenine synthase/tRNA threonylcarbamoyladenosine biosynthesis protein TsaB
MTENKIKILAIETSTNLGGISILENDKVLFTKNSREQKSHSELVHQFIEEGLAQLNFKLSDFQIYAVSEGPGSFTGIRVAVNTGKTYSYVYKKPLIGISSLHCLAFQNLEKILNSPKPISNIFCMINAYKNMVYYAKFKINSEFLIKLNKPFNALTAAEKASCLIEESEPQVIPVKDLHLVLSNPSWVIGDGYITYEKYFSDAVRPLIQRIIDGEDYPTSIGLGQLAYDHYLNHKNSSTFEWNSFTPLYLRASEAEENKKGILYSPL